jgi:2-keto-4-pentenoate hydratase/2-oxohepta-3-ene-1,7-dioic acid hydratase in catechol pathway
MPVTEIVRVGTRGGPVWGRVDGGEVTLLPDGPCSGVEGDGRAIGPVDAVELLAPATPTKIVCVARNYRAHAAEHGVDVPERPLLFLKPPSAVIGPGRAIELPPESSQVEHEAELAVVIGRRCRRVGEDEAWKAVLGVTCANDVTARDIQRSEKLWTRGKGFDTFCPVGPSIVAGIEHETVDDLGIRCSVNGENRQHGRTDQMVFSPSFLISYISQVMTLEPGDLVLTGTPSGVSPLRPGDEVTVEIEGIGSLTNHVVADVGD